MTQKFDLAVIGCGGMGLSALYSAANRGLSACGFEKFQIGHSNGSTHGETRIIRKAYFEHPDYVPLLERSYDLWDELSGRSERELFTRSGLVIIGDRTSSSILAGVKKSAELYNIGIHEDWVPTTEFFRTQKNEMSLLEPDAGYICVDEAVRTFASEAKKSGAVIFENEPVLEFKLGDGVFIRTVTREITAKSLVISVGAWSGNLVPELASLLKINRCFLYWFLPEPEFEDQYRKIPCFGFHEEGEFIYGFPSFGESGVKIARHLPGAQISDPAEKDQSDSDIVEQKFMQDFVSRRLVGLNPIPKAWKSCLYTMSPDENFIIDQLPGHPNVSFAAGLSGHGYKFAPVIGEILVDLAVADRTEHRIGFLRRRN